jgi:hypothetical protein
VQFIHSIAIPKQCKSLLFPLLLGWMVIWMILGCSVSLLAQPQPTGSREAYLAQWKGEAVYQMALHGIPASITLAQGILESGDGESTLASRSNNHFGIKCHSDWTGATVRHDDDRQNECFRAYDDAAQSFEDHSVFLKKTRYEPLFALDITDYKGWAKGLKKCGYATNPKYDRLLIELIERHDLTAYDQEGLQLMAEREDFAANLADVSEKNDRLNPKAPVVMLGTRAAQLSENHIQFILAESGDRYDLLALELDMMPWQFYRYNEIKRQRGAPAYSPQVGEIVYLQPKRTRGKSLWLETHEDETLWDVSQRCGIKMSSLTRKNRLSPENPMKPGQKLSLKWRVKKDGKLPSIVRMWSVSSG